MATQINYNQIKSAPANVMDYGATGDGTTNDTAAFTAALAAASSVYAPAGTYLLTTEVVIGDNKTLFGAGPGSTIFKAGTNNQNILHLTGSNSVIENFQCHYGNKSGVSALRITPLNETQITTRVDQNYNRIRNFVLQSCAEGIVMMCGPNVLGADSGCWYNIFAGGHIQNGTRGMWFKTAPGGGAGVNRNQFYGVRIGQNCNTGVQIDSGNTNGFYGVDFEGVDTGVSPNATPTAIKIAAGGMCESNRFFGSNFEGCTRHIDNANIFTELHGCNYDGSKILFTAIPLISFGGYGPSFTPQIGMGSVFQTNAQIAGYGNGVTTQEVFIKGGGIQFKRQGVAGTGAAAANTDLGGYLGATGPGGGTLTRDYELPYNIGSIYGGQGQLYLGWSQATSYANPGTKNATRYSLFTETSSGVFVEINLSNTLNNWVTHTITLTRAGANITQTIVVALVADTACVCFNLIRIA